MIAAVREQSGTGSFAGDVLEGLTRPGQKTLPSSWLYDDVGSALFEVITLLPEYGLTRADAALLLGAAGAIAGLAGQPRRIVEFGSGSGTKTRCILEAALACHELEYVPVDISRSALTSCAATLRELPGLTVRPVESRYLSGLPAALSGRGPDDRALLLFLGSTIGNFSPDDAAGFLRSAREQMRPGDSLLLGTDLVKPREQLLAAYDDPLGVTAAFNLNLLGRINRELSGEFVLGRFAHEARFDQLHSRIEMHLRSRVAQKVWIEDLHRIISFEAGETIWTESSHKFRTSDIAAMGAQSGWTLVRQWVDHTWGFAETLFTA